MTQDLKDVFREAIQLPETDRATLAGLLIESLEPAPMRASKRPGPKKPSGAGKKSNPAK